MYNMTARRSETAAEYHSEDAGAFPGGMSNAAAFGDVLDDFDDDDFGDSVVTKEKTPDSIIPAPEPPPAMKMSTSSASFSRPRTPGVGPRSPSGLIMSNPDRKMPSFPKSPASKPVLLLHSSDEEDILDADEGASPAPKSKSPGTPAAASSSSPGASSEKGAAVPSPERPRKTVTLTKPTTESLVGITTTNFDEEGLKAVKVENVKEGGLAAACGLKAGDAILKINGLPIARHEQFAELIKAAEGTVKIEVATPPPPPLPPKPPATKEQPAPPRNVTISKPSEEAIVGIVAVNLEGDEKGVAVKEIQKGRLAEKAGLAAGDIIKKINGLVVTRHEMFSELLRGAAGDITLEVHSRAVASDPILASPPLAAASEKAYLQPKAKDTAAATNGMPLPKTIPYPHPATAPVVPSR